MEQNNSNLSATKRLRLIESVMPAAKDAPEIVETLRKMGVPDWDIAKIMAGETVGHDESLVNPEDGLPHFIRHCDIAVDNDPDTHTYFVSIDGHRVPDFFAGVLSGELALMDPDKLLAENRYLRSLNADAQEDIKRLRKRVDYLNSLIDRFKISIRHHAD